MKSNPLVGGLGGLSIQRWSRWARFAVASCAAAVGATLWAQTNAVSTVAGTVSTPGFSNTAPGTFRFTNPSGVAVDSSGNLFVADAVNNVIRKIAISGSTVTITTFAGSATGVAGSADGNGTAASFSSPQGITIDGTNTLYVADSGNHSIRRITSTGDVVTLAGSSGAPGNVSGTGTTARFSSPLGIVADRAGAGGAAVNLFVADSQNNSIRQVVVGTGAVNTGVVSTLAGSTTGQSGSTNNSNNIGTDARFNGPAGITANGAGTTIFVADRFNNLIRQILITGGTNVNVSTLAGSGTAAYAEGTGATASFSGPTGIALNSAGTAILVSDTLNHVIRSITTGGVTSLLAGTPNTGGFADGVSTSAKFNFPSGIAAGASTTYIVDTNNAIIRSIAPPTGPTINTQPTSASVQAGNNATFTVAASGTPSVTYQWQSSTDAGTTFNNLTNGVGGVSGATTNQLTITAVTIALSNTQYRVVVGNGFTTQNSNAVSLTVTQAPAFTSANNVTFVTGQANTFTVTATGVPAPDINVTAGSYPGSFAPNLNGTQVKGNGQTTATISGTPTDTTGSPFNFTITASNGVGTAATQAFTLTVSSTTPPSLSTVANQQLTSGATTAVFSVTATGTPATFTYQWERSTDGGTTFNALTNTTIDGATYNGATAAALAITGISPNMNGNLYRVVVTSGGGTRTSNAATLSVPPVITSAASYTFVTGQNNTFTFTAAGSPAPTFAILGTLPNGLNFSSPFVSGTPTDVSSSTQITVTATNSGGSTQQTFSVIVSSPQAPVITSFSAASFNVGQFGTFTFTASGSPSPTLQLLGALPGGVTFNSLTGVLSGTPTDTAGSPFTLTIQAQNSSGTASQTFTLTVLGVGPTITTHPINVTGNVGQVVTFTAAATGTPTPTVRWQRQPSGTSDFVNLTDDGVYSGTTTNTLTINGVTAAMSLDRFRILATNGTPPDATSNSAQLTVNLGTVISTLAGLPGFSGPTDGTGSTARFNSPAQIATDNAGTIYVADTANHVIRKVTSTGVVTTLAGLPGFAGSTDGTGSDARFNSPQGIAVDGAGNVYVADTFNQTIRLVSPGGVVTTIAGAAGAIGALDAVAGNALNARFFGPSALAVDAFGNVYVADTSNHAIRRVSASRDVTTVAGLLGTSGFLDGSGTNARFNSPSGVALDSSGNLYVSDSFNHVIRRVTSGSVVTLAGAAGTPGITDGIGAAARFNRPTGIAVDSSGNLYIADTSSSIIRKMVISTTEVTTIAGLALNPGTADGAGSTARFNLPIGVAVDVFGNLYIADTRNHTIRRSGSPIAPQIQTQPVSKVASIGQSVTFTATATGAPLPGYQWQRATAANPGTFVSLSNDATYSGVTTGNLTVSNVTADMNGDQFRVIANNGVSPVATSSAVILTTGTAPVFTSANSATFRAGESGSFQVAVTSTPAVTYSLTNNPSWLSINAAGLLAGTPPDTTGSPLTITINANNGLTATQTFTLTLLPAQVLPAFTSQPVGATVNQGGTATFTAVVTGLPAPAYQWRLNGVSIPGATGSSLTVANAQPANAGIYTLAATNVLGTVTSNAAALVVNTAPVFVAQPRAQVAQVGSTVTFSVTASGTSNFDYQWRKNGVAIQGATGPTLVLPNVSAADAGNYDVFVSNALGSIGSSLAQLTIVTAPAAPVITQQPASRIAAVGGTVTLVAAASGAPSPSYQWRKNNQNITGANGATFTISNVSAGDAGIYDVVVSNAVSSVTSNPVVLRVIARSYAGIYFGTFSSNLGSFAIYVRDDNTGVFLGYLPGSTAPLMTLNLSVTDTGQFTFTQGSVGTTGGGDEPARAAALASTTVIAAIASDGTLTGSLQGGANGTLAGLRSPSGGSTQGVAGFYQAGATGNATTAYTVASPDGRAFVVLQSGANSDGGQGSISATGVVQVPASRSVITETISGSTISGSSTGGIIAAFSGGSDAANARQRLLNISSRARVGTADAVAIAGFVISGEESKPVLIRAVGPTLGSAFNVGGALASPRLELFNSKNASLAVNTGIGTGTGRAAIDAAGVQSGAFPLGTAGTDAAILTTLAPGAYTAVVNSTTSTTGIALIEVYDLSAASPGQKLLNISTRAAAGTAEATLTAGFVVPPGPAKRVLVRGIGPGLSTFGVTGVLAQPILTVLNGGTTVATNTGYVNSADRADILTASTQVGAFPPATADSAVLITLPAGNYTAQVVGPAGATGVALIEVYEVP